jgi:NADPH-dependent 2,4-dienoyl-CoA reductase/sulfur reductase-like enzyme
MGTLRMNPTNVTPRPRVVILGAGFGGLSAAKALANSPVDVTIVDQHNYHLFQPLLYQVATAGLSPADIASPIRSIMRDARNVSVVLAKVGKIDVGRREVVAENRVSRSNISLSQPARSTPILVTTNGRQRRRASRRSTTRRISGAVSCLRSRRLRPSPIRPNARGF